MTTAPHRRRLADSHSELYPPRTRIALGPRVAVPVGGPSTLRWVDRPPHRTEPHRVRRYLESVETQDVGEPRWTWHAAWFVVGLLTLGLGWWAWPLAYAARVRRQVVLTYVEVRER